MMSYSPFSSNEKVLVLFLALKGEKEKEEKRRENNMGV